MDDVAVMSKVAAKTAGILGDDLAVNAESFWLSPQRTSCFMGHCKVHNKQSNHFTHRFC
jgi:hypothetical protein